RLGVLEDRLSSPGDDQALGGGTTRDHPELMDGLGVGAGMVAFVHQRVDLVGDGAAAFGTFRYDTPLFPDCFIGHVLRADAPLGTAHSAGALRIGVDHKLVGWHGFDLDVAHVDSYAVDLAKLVTR